MPILFDLPIIWAATLTSLVFLMIRYFVIAGILHSVFYIIKPVALVNKKIQEKQPTKRDIKREIVYSLLSLVVFSSSTIAIVLLRQNGYFTIYKDIHEYGYIYFVLSIPMMLIIHDTYFYWTHRFMHWKPVYKVMHRVHHQSTNPTPWASFSFHPTEAVVETSIIFVILALMPVHPLAIFIFLTMSNFINALGHLGYELYPKGFTRHWLGKWNNTSVHHNMHHRLVNCNYGLYFNVWDRIMKTNHPFYHSHYNRVKKRQSPIEVGSFSKERSVAVPYRIERKTNRIA